VRGLDKKFTKKRSKKELNMKQQNLLFMFFAGALLIFCNRALSYAVPVQLPQTGQTTCYDASGNVIACAGTGQDGALQEGVAWPSPRFTDNGDQTQTDNLTGMIWPKDGSTPTIGSCTGGAMTWQGALDYVACLNTNNYIGHSDWRLPNINELESVVNAGRSNTDTWLNEQGFSYVQPGDYWSSTAQVDYPYDAWLVDMGGVASVTNKSVSSYVWPVRGGQSGSFGYSASWRTGQTTCYGINGNSIACAGTGQDGELQEGVAWPLPRFTDNGDQSVTDNLTNLMWTKSANAPGPSACGSGTNMTWQGALNYVACLNTNNYLAYNDWRLPNRKEMYSLLDFSQYLPPIPSVNPFTNVQSGYYYWTSTSIAYYPSYAWHVNMYDGYVVNGNKSDNDYVWPVRGGQSGSSVTFADVPLTEPFYGYIEAIYNDGITQGCGNGDYCPSYDVTRDQMAAFLIRALYGANFTYTQTPYFSDVPATDYFFEYIQKMKDMSITIMSGAYLPGEDVTRDQMAAFLVRATQVKAGQGTENFTCNGGVAGASVNCAITTPYFSDVSPATDSFFPYIQKFYELGITIGCNNGQFPLLYCPSEDVTRDQMAAFLARAFLGMK